MKVYELFSKRQKRLRGEVPDIYQYEIIPQELRVQIVHIWRAVLKDAYSGDAQQVYESLHQKLSYEYGKFTLDQNGDSGYHRTRNDSYHVTTVINFFLSTDDIERAIDVIELSFRFIDQDVRHSRHGYFRPSISPDDAINELNYRFREHGVGYQYKSGKIIKVDSEFTHSEVIKPAMSFLSDPIYKGANEEFLNAHEHYRKGRYKECLNDCLKAFESCLKIICQKRSWNYNKGDTANRLIAIVFDNELIPPLRQSHFSGLRSALESGVPTVRNNWTGHGQGTEEITVPEYIAAYILHLTASNILLLIKADEDMK